MTAEFIEQQVRRAALTLADSVLDLLEADYYYDEIGEKRWVLGDGGTSGNCDLCEENGEAGWIPEDDVYPNTDEPPQHYNCTCEEEFRERRVRVYDEEQGSEEEL